jgi:ribonuclease P protein component
MTDEAHFSAEQSGPQAPARLSRASGDAGRPQHPACPPRTGPQEPERLSQAPAAPCAVGQMTRRADYLAANRGQRQTTPGFILLVHNRRDDDSAVRLGITVSKKVGGAVIRNRMKRRFRALARELLPERGIAGADHVLIGRKDGIERDFGALRTELATALERAARRRRRE